MAVFAQVPAGYDQVRRDDSIKQVLQRQDSIRLQDSIQRVQLAARRDSIVRATDSINARLAISRWQSVDQMFGENSYFRFRTAPVKMNIEQREKRHDEGLFYYLAGLVFFFALIRIIFYRYLSNLTSLFFRVTMRQQQIREQLLQTPLASLLLNILFVLVAGTYLAFLSNYYRFITDMNFWLLIVYSVAFVAAIYGGKYIFLKIVGWLFNVQQATDMYIFVVFWVNKMLGMILLPFLVLMAFPHPDLHAVIVNLSLALVVFLFLYRFFLSYRPVRNEIKVNKFHFFLYLCAFEITPLILIYKVLLNYVEHGT